jgi:hypothetical protein
MRDAANGIRAAVVVAVAAASVWLAWHRIPQRYAEWTKLMTAVQQRYRPPMAVYMQPGPATGTPRFLGSYLDLPPDLRDIDDLSAATEAQFLREIAESRAFVFLVHGRLSNDTLRRRTRLLDERGYDRSTIRVWGAYAEVFTPGESRAALSDALHTLVVYRLAGARRTGASLVTTPLPARDVHEEDGGDSGSLHDRWVLGAEPWDAVGQTRQQSGGLARDGLWAHPRNGTTLVIEGSRGAGRGFYGFTDYSLARAAEAGVTAPVRIRILAGDRTLLDREARRTAGWTEFTLPADAAGAIRIEITSAADAWAHFVFDLRE